MTSIDVQLRPDEVWIVTVPLTYHRFIIPMSEWQDFYNQVREVEVARRGFEELRIRVDQIQLGDVVVGFELPINALQGTEKAGVHKIFLGPSTHAPQLLVQSDTMLTVRRRIA